jgi:hypothetical protein
MFWGIDLPRFTNMRRSKGAFHRLDAAAIMETSFNRRPLPQKKNKNEGDIVGERCIS